MSTFTSSLPDGLLSELADYSKKLSIPKNKIIETALKLYLEHLNKAEYIKSYKMAAIDQDILCIAEEGMEDYFQQLEK